VLYKGAGPLLTDLLGGYIDFAFAALLVTLLHINAGKIKAIAVSSPARSRQLPDVPAINESTPEFEFPAWIDLVAPKGLPKPVREKNAQGGERRHTQPPGGAPVCR